MNSVCGHIISGQEVKDDGNKIEVYNPVNEKQVTTITSAKPDTIDKAIKSSIEAQKKWKSFSISKRTSILFEFKVLLEKNEEKIARLVGEDLGKVFEDARGELRRGIENVEYACGIGEILKGEYNKNISNKIKNVV